MTTTITWSPVESLGPWLQPLPEVQLNPLVHDYNHYLKSSWIPWSTTTTITWNPVESLGPRLPPLPEVQLNPLVHDYNHYLKSCWIPWSTTTTITWSPVESLGPVGLAGEIVFAVIPPVSTHWLAQWNISLGLIANLHVHLKEGRKEMFYLTRHSTQFSLRLYGVGHMVKDHSDSERGNPLLPHWLLFLINSKGSFICTIPRPLLYQSWSTGWNEK